MRALALLTLLVAVGCLACSSFRDSPYEVIEGQFFDTRLVSSIEDGQTTADQILEWFGQPIERHSLDAGETWRYQVVRERKSVENPILGAKKVHVQTLEQQLVIQLSGGRVVSHRYESGTKGDCPPALR